MKTIRLSDFYNTISLSGEELDRARVKAHTQAGQILDLFHKNPDAMMTPIEVLDILKWKAFRITSVRRAMTNLSDGSRYADGVAPLVKTSAMKVERYGMSNHYWKLNRSFFVKQISLF